jgi:CRP-like cAMP-binding protein
MRPADTALERLVRKLSVHSELSREDQRAILGLPCTVKTLEAHTYTVREGDPPEGCFVLLSGFAFRQKLTGEGARQIVAVHIPGEPLDFQNVFLDVADHSVQLLTRAEVAFIPRRALLELARSNPSIAHAILVTILVEASIFREWVLNVGRRDARTRVAHLLCEFAIRLEAYELTEEYGYELPMSQEQIADAVGLTSVHVNRTLKALESEGLIKRNRRFVSIPDWQRMRQVGDFSDRYLHLGPQTAGTSHRRGE